MTQEEELKYAKALIEMLSQLQRDIETVITRTGAFKISQVKDLATQIRECRYYTNNFREKVFPEGSESRDSYRATMIAIAAQLVVDNCDLMIERRVFRHGVKNTGQKMITEMMRFVDNDLKSVAAVEQYIQLVGWFEGQFETAFKVSMLDSEKQQKFFDGWMKLLNETGINIEGL